MVSPEEIDSTLVKGSGRGIMAHDQIGATIPTIPLWIVDLHRFQKLKAPVRLLKSPTHHIDPIPY
jgi:hypothetical protein